MKVITVLNYQGVQKKTTTLGESNVTKKITLTSSAACAILLFNASCGLGSMIFVALSATFLF